MGLRERLNSATSADIEWLQPVRGPDGIAASQVGDGAASLSTR